MRRVCETIHLTSAGLWLGAVAMTGVAAASIFPTLKALSPALPGYAEYTGPHWSLAAGQVAARVFVLGDVIQLACGLMAFATFGLLLVRKELPRTTSTLARGLGLSAALMILAYRFFYLQPRMDDPMRRYWQLAAEGRSEDALAAKAAFDVLHPQAETLLVVTMLCVLLTLVAGAWSVAASSPRRSVP